MKTIYIYTLSDPRNNLVRYVGKTNNPNMRLKNHLNRRHNERTHKRNWIDSLKKNNLKPLFEIIDEVPINEWKFWEKFWIQMMIVWGFDLVNHTSGGDGLTFGNQTSFKTGNVPWNNGTANEIICEICGNGFNAPISAERKFCSMKCRGLYYKSNPNSGTFKIGSSPWNKGLKTGISEKSKIVQQYDREGNFIQEYDNCRIASEKYKCNPENIRNCCNGHSKSAKNYIWKYK
jgi:hypothetical protein